MGRRFLRKKMNNSGAALVTVIVVIAFISVLATVVLYMSGTNYYMKATDKKNKDSFYDAETAMENIRAALMVEAQGAYQDAYQETVMYFLQDNAAARNDRYRQAFTDAMKVRLEANINAYGGDPDGLQLYLRAVGGYGDQLVTPSVSTDIEYNYSKGQITIKNVSIQHDLDTYVAMITTDFLVEAPKIDWDTDSSADNWVVGETMEALTRKKISIADSVMYANWKKE